MKTNHIDCICSSLEHTVKIHTFDDDKDYVYISIFLTDKMSLYKRIWYAFLYVIGKHPKYGYATEIILDRNKIKEVENLCNEFLGS